jgi:hypothetical protein
LRLALLAVLRRRRRLAALAPFFDELAAQDPAALGPLLPFDSPPVVARHFEAARPCGGVNFWRRLARFHPDLAVERLTNSIEASLAPDARLRWEANTTLEILAKRHPDHGVKLARLLMRHGPTGPLALDRLARRRPAEMTDLLLAADCRVPVNLTPVAHRLDSRRLLALLERQPDTLTPPHVWFRRLPPARRAEVFHHSAKAWRDAEGCLDPQVLRSLPRAPREQEGRRHLDLPALATRPAVRLGYATFLPWEEARRFVDPWLNHPQAELRSAALQAVIGATRDAGPTGRVCQDAG